MAQNVTIAGNQYPSVPSIQIPKTGGGGNATFTDTSPTTASASDVAQGKIFFDSTGTQQTGTASGGGGDDAATGIIEATISGTYSNASAIRVKAYTFTACYLLESVNFPMASEIGTSAFAAIRDLTTVSFPTATFISNYAFFSCSNLKNVYIPLATTISTSAFYSCSRITSVEFSLATSVGNGAFGSCHRLSRISFPMAKSINQLAFTNCSSLTTVSFPALLTLGASAFRNCSKLESVYLLNSSVATGAANMFISTPLSASSYLGYFGSIYVRASLLSAWQSKTQWSAYSARMVGLTDEQIAALG